MKTLFSSLYALVFLMNIYTQTDSTGRWHCGTVDTGEVLPTGPIQNQNMNVVIVFLDFPDGRLSNGQVPTQDTQLEPGSIQNLDAVFNMGYVSNDGQTFNRKARKLTYQQFWNIYFSEDTYVTDAAHPDWMSHGRFGWPRTGDTARAWGSLKDYYKEVSNNNLILQPFVTHSNQTGIYRTGIVNNIVVDALGNKYVEPIMLPNAKLSHYNIPNNNFQTEYDGFSLIQTDADARIQALYNLGVIEFNPSTFTGKIIYLFAGGTYIVGGTGGGNKCTIREKLTANSFLQSNDPLLKYSVVNGVAIVCHEFGHMLGWRHTVHGNYDIMNGNGKDIQNCPSHPNIFYKLGAGWIDESRIRKIRTTTELANLPPVELDGDIGVVTVYGKPGYDNNWVHSEYYLFENRRMFERNDLTVKFDKKLVWRRTLNPPTPNGFNGGLLINHYINYNRLNTPAVESIFLKLINASTERLWNLIYDDGDSRDFFGVPVAGGPPNPIFDVLSSNRTNSSFNIPTGLSFTNIIGGSAPNYTISFNTNYTIEEPPDYSYVNYLLTLPATLNFSGYVFMHSNYIRNTQLNIAPGTVLDFPDQSMTTTNANIDAPGTWGNPISFRGCGYGQYRLSFKGLLIGNRPSNSPTNQPTRVTFCNFNNLNNETAIQVATTTATSIPLILENNSSTPPAKIEISPVFQDLTIYSITNNNMDVHLKANTGKIKVTGAIFIPQNRTVFFYPYTNGAQYLFDNSTFLDVVGNISALGSSETDKIIFDKISNFYSWYTIHLWGSGNFKYCDIKNSQTGITISYPLGSFSIENCFFENNGQRDIALSGFYNGDGVPNIIQNNIFNSNSTQIASIITLNGNNVEIKNNTFNDVWNTGIFFSYVSNPQVIENLIYASTNPSASPVAGVLSYSSAGNINCNYPTNFYNGILLDNSSPKMFNNTITNNSVGLFLTNGSSPQMTPSFSGNLTLYDGGYNHIFNNMFEEIKCNNDGGPYIPISLPNLDNGYNAIYHEGVNDCLIDIGTQPFFPYSVTNNYWGTNGPSGRICPTYAFINYQPYLTDEPQYLSCYPVEQTANNSSMSQEVLLLGSANIDYYNGNYSSASNKYKQLIIIGNNSQKSYLPVSRIYHSTILDSLGDFLSLESYYSVLSQQYSNDTLFSRKSSSFSTGSDVMQPAYEEAVNEYETVVNSTQNPVERHYAIIDQLRAIQLMLDSLLNGYGGDSPSNNVSFGRYDLNSILNNSIINNVSFSNKGRLFSKKEGKHIFSVSAYNSDKINEQLKIVKKFLGIAGADIENSTLQEKATLIDKIVAYKIYEYSIMNISDERPLNRVAFNLSSKHRNVIPNVFRLFQNYPNPFNPISTIKFNIPKETKVLMKIYDLLGKEIKTLVNEVKQPGYYEVLFDGTNFASGVYIYRIEAGTFVDTKKMVLVK